MGRRKKIAAAAIGAAIAYGYLYAPPPSAARQQERLARIQQQSQKRREGMAQNLRQRKALATRLEQLQASRARMPVRGLRRVPSAAMLPTAVDVGLRRVPSMPTMPTVRPESWVAIRPEAVSRIPTAQWQQPPGFRQRLRARLPSWTQRRSPTPPSPGYSPRRGLRERLGLRWGAQQSSPPSTPTRQPTPAGLGRDAQRAYERVQRRMLRPGFETDPKFQQRFDTYMRAIEQLAR